MTLAEIYSKTCSTYNKTKAEGGAEAWENVLGRFSSGDVEKAVFEWQSRTDICDFTGRPTGALMPTPADIARICERLKLAREAADKFTPCKSCVEGWVDIEVPDSSPRGSHMAQTRCECWKQWLEGRQRAARHTNA